jgi:hypothetical protein
MLNVAELAPAAATGAKYPHIEQLLEQHVLLLPAERVCGVEVCDTVGELAQRAAQLVVFAVVVAALDAIAAHHGRLPVIIVGLVGVEVDLAKLALLHCDAQSLTHLPEELLLMVLEFSRHGGLVCYG